MSVIIPKDGLPNREALQEFLKQHEYSSTSAYKAEQAGKSWMKQAGRLGTISAVKPTPRHFEY